MGVALLNAGMNCPHPQPCSQDAAGELFRHIARTAESPLKPPTLGDFEFMLPQSWELGGLKSPPELPTFLNVKFANPSPRERTIEAIL